MPESTQLLQKTSPQAYPVVNDTVDEVRHEMFEHHDIKPNLTEEPGKYNRTYIDNPPAIEAGKRQDFARELAKDLTHHKDQYMQEVVVAPAAAEGGTVAESRQPGAVEVAPGAQLMPLSRVTPPHAGSRAHAACALASSA